MRSVKLIILSLALIISKVAYSQSWQMVWQDEFNYTGLADANKWEYEVWAPGAFNNEKQAYTNKRLENGRVEAGKLIIEARRDFYNGSEYSSARLRTQGKGDWLYGRVEVNAKLPGGRGTWPAIWMLPSVPWSYGDWPNSGEIDIMEYVGVDPYKVHASCHTRDRNFRIGTQYTVNHINTTVESSFHTYAMEWSPEKIDFYFDNIKYGTYNNDGTGFGVWPFDKPFHLILNVAVGGDWGGMQGIDNTIFPKRMEVEYVRVYKQSSTPVITGTYYIQNRNSNLFMDVSAGSSADGAKIVQWGANNASNQQFTFNHLGNGIYQIVAGNSGKSFDIEGVSTADGAKLHQWTYGGGANRKFKVVPTGDGYYKFIASHSNKVVEVAGFSTSSGAAIQQWTDGNQRSGHWKLVPVTPSFTTTIQAESFTSMSGVQTDATTDTGSNSYVGWIDTNDWMAYNSINIPSTGSYKIEYRVASPVATGRLSLDLNAGSVQLGSLSIPNTGGWQNWTTISHNVNLNAGTFNFGIFAAAGGWNINWFRITRNTARLAPAEVVQLSSGKIYPTQVDSKLSLNIANGFKGAQVKVLSIDGASVISGLSSEEGLDVSKLKPGIYSIIISKDGATYREKFIKN